MVKQSATTTMGMTRTAQAVAETSSPAGISGRPRRPLLPAIGGDEHVVGEDDRAAGEFGTIDGLELPNGVRAAVRLVGGLIGELEEVDEPGGVVLLLPGRVHPAARLVLGDVLHELGDRGLDLVHR